MKQYLFTICLCFIATFTFSQENVIVGGKVIDPAQIERSQANLATVNARLEADPGNQEMLLAKTLILERLSVILGDSRAGSDYFSKAVGTINSALEAEPYDFDLNFKAGQLFYKQALLIRNITAQLDESDPSFSKHTEKFYNMMEGSLTYFQRAYGIDQGNPNLNAALKDAYQSLGMLDEAKTVK